MAGWFVIAKNMVDEIRQQGRTDDMMLHDVVVRTLYELSHYSGLREPDSMVWLDSRVEVRFGDKAFGILTDGTFDAVGDRIKTTQALWKWLTSEGVVSGAQAVAVPTAREVPGVAPAGDRVESNHTGNGKVGRGKPPKRKGR